MYDVNYDEFEPVGQSGGTYSTARPKRKRHVGLAIGMSLLAVIACAATSLISLYSMRIERSAGTTKVIFTERNPDISAAEPVDDVPEQPVRDERANGATLEIQKPCSEDPQDRQAIYARLIPSVVSVVSSSPDDSVECCGVIMSPDGYIITSCSIARNPAAVSVLLHDGAEHIASVVGSDPLSDLAVLKIDAEGLCAAEFGDCSQLCVGEPVLAIGDPMGRELRGAMTDGIISGISRDLDVEGRTMTILQTNASLRSGGCGGPLINMRGQVIGIAAGSIGAFASSDDRMGLAIPIDNAKSIVDDLIEHGYIPGRPSIGLGGQSVTSAAQAYYRLPAGVYVETVDPDGAAARAGVLPGDIITAIDGVSVSSLEELNLIKNRCKAGDVVTLGVFRNGQALQIDIILGEIRR